MRSKGTLFGSAVLGLGLAALVGARMKSPPDQEGEARVPSLRTATYSLDCSATGQPISPLIYGTGGTEPPWDLNIASRRWGGNPTTRYNWEINTTNLTKDWFFKNVEGGPGGYPKFLLENREHGVKTALTVPIIGWVAKDSSSYSFPVAAFGPQQPRRTRNFDCWSQTRVPIIAFTPSVLFLAPRRE